jgi:hypothetical protein
MCHFRLCVVNDKNWQYIVPWMHLHISGDGNRPAVDARGLG